MKSIRTRIVTAIILMAVIPSVVLQTISISNTISVSLNTSKESMIQLAEAEAERTHYQLQSYINVAETAGCNPTFSNDSVSIVEKQNILNTLAISEGFERGNIINKDGRSIFDGKDYSERDYFQKAIKGETYVSDPLLSKVTGQYAIIVAAPLWKFGIHGGEVAGCIYFAPPASFLREIMNDIELSSSSSAYMINSEGTIIASKSSSGIEEQISIIQSAQEDSSYQALADIHARVIAGGTACETYQGSDGTVLTAYAPVVSDISGWYLILEEPIITFFQGTLDTIIFMIVLTVGFCVLAGIVAFIISRGIVRPIQACSRRIRDLSLGDLQSPVVKVKSDDEVGVLAESTGHLIYNLKVMISDVNRILSATAKGDLTSDIGLYSESYVGDFAALQSSMEEIIKGLTGIVGKLDSTSEQVADGSEQVSSAAQSLSQGSTEQASSVEHLADSISGIAAKTDENLEECEEAKKVVNVSAEYLQQANDQMHHMTAAMKRIGTASDKIEKIIKTIEDIAFQTNILALNAAVEAAKVGEAGKGFAVVADEVRNLAAKSQESAKGTSALIIECSSAVKDGMNIAAETAETLNSVVQYSGGVIQIVGKVADSSEEQAAAIKEISKGIDQISSVVQTNSATAEQCAAASEELSGQSQILKGLVNKFVTIRRSEEL